MMIHKAVDGSIAITTFAPEVENDPELKADAIKKFKEMHPGIYNESYEGDFEYPDDKGQFRNAWTLVDNKIVIHEGKAREIHMNRIREYRNRKLDELDKEHLRFLSDPVKVSEIESRKQELRDLPANVNNLEWPEILGELKW